MSEREATPEELPAALCRSPWRPKREATPVRVLALPPLPYTERVADADTLLNVPAGEPTALRVAFVDAHHPALAPGVSVAAPMATFGVASFAAYLRVADTDPAAYGRLLARHADSPRFARWFAHLWAKGHLRHHAETWMERFPAAAAIGLLPHATGAPGAARLDATRALAFLVQAPTPSVLEAVTRATAAWPPEAERFVRHLAADGPRDVRDQYPAPKLPDWFVASDLPALALNNGSLVPRSVYPTLATMLRLSRLEMPYIGLDEVRSACDPASLTALSWAIFEAWEAAGGRTADGWGLDQLGLVGGDGVVARLAARVRAWPGRSLSARARAGLDVLGAIGTNWALAQVDDIAKGIRHAALQEHARRTLAEIARGRGLTPTELADRLIPDHVEAAPLLAARLERAMCNNRFWTREEWHTGVCDSPVMAPLVGRLVWRLDGGETFTVCDDHPPRGPTGEPVALADSAHIHVAHPVSLAQDVLAAWRAAFVERGVEQPFEQLWRPFARPTDAERDSHSLERRTGHRVPLTALLRLLDAGWRRGGDSGDDPHTREMILPMPNGWDAVLQLRTGYRFGRQGSDPVQVLGPVLLGPLRVRDLDPVVYSELTRQLDGLGNVG